ncbi:Replication stress response regulator SDE2 [Frankliniella fusca]|uniref:Replication stress response regulator SDE2 n=1 Tax=Frankliniella fusca TaxID=407009 RepID=A0AAE1HUM8_9NEOP|nr:Replication stress response regulator SDE2 [Frankliniella fusca]
MLTIYCDGLGVSQETTSSHFLLGPITRLELESWAQNELLLSKEELYFLHNGKRISNSAPITDGVVRVIPRLVGGKGGFGSMLRAIGAQIEKTTNREACRDLSGRRLRDINEEKRLKDWISKKADREREAAERRKKKLEKLRSEPKIEFSDKKYEEERSKLSEVVHDAVEKGFQASVTNPSTSGSTSTVKKPSRKGFMFEEDEISDDSTSSSDEPSDCEQSKRALDTGSDSDEPSPAKRKCVDNDKSDSSDESASEEENACKFGNENESSGNKLDKL